MLCELDKYLYFKVSRNLKYRDPKNKTEALVLLKKHNKYVGYFCDFQACLAYYISLAYYILLYRMY